MITGLQSTRKSVLMKKQTKTKTYNMFNIQEISQPLPQSQIHDGIMGVFYSNSISLLFLMLLIVFIIRGKGHQLNSTNINSNSRILQSFVGQSLCPGLLPVSPGSSGTMKRMRFSDLLYLILTTQKIRFENISISTTSPRLKFTTILQTNF